MKVHQDHVGPGQFFFQKLVGQQGGPAGLALEKWTMGETAFHRESGMFRGRLLAACRTLLVAETDPAGEFLGFTVKGGITHDIRDNP